MKKLLCAAAGLLLMTACGTPKANLPLEGTSWKLVEMNGEQNPAFAAEEDSFHFTLNAEDKMVAGVGACNRLFGPYTLSGEGAIDIERLASTMMACPNLDLETAFVKVLEDMDRYTVSGDELTLYKGSDKLAVLKGAAAAPAAEGAANGAAAE